MVGRASSRGLDLKKRHTNQIDAWDSYKAVHVKMLFPCTKISALKHTINHGGICQSMFILQVRKLKLKALTLYFQVHTVGRKKKQKKADCSPRPLGSLPPMMWDLSFLPDPPNPSKFQFQFLHLPKSDFVLTEAKFIPTNTQPPGASASPV